MYSRGLLVCGISLFILLVKNDVGYIKRTSKSPHNTTMYTLFFPIKCTRLVFSDILIIIASILDIVANILILGTILQQS